MVSGQNTICILRKYLLLFILLITAFNLSVNAGNIRNYIIRENIKKGRIEGVVIDKVNGNPLVGATILIKKLEKGNITDKYGKFLLKNIPYGEYFVTITYVGYKSQTKKVLVNNISKELLITLEEEDAALNSVVVKAKSEAREIKEKAMPVTVINMKQLQGTVSDVQSILAKTVGVNIRSSGGLGSPSRISVRGLEGKRIGIFIDEIPVGEQSDYISLNDIPIDMIERIEVYKGIVPAKFGGSSMGGAVNLVLKTYPSHYGDFSYMGESFGVNKTQAVLKRNLRNLGIVLGMGGSYTHAKNNYIMESPYIKGLKIKRNHDLFSNLLFGASLKSYKWWFDEVEFEFATGQTYKQLQGIQVDIRKAHTKSEMYIFNNTLKKKDFIIQGLDFNMTTAMAYTHYSIVDTAKTWYDWYGNDYRTNSIYGGELDTRFASNSNNRKFTIIHKLNLEYLITKNHSINFNSFFSLANGYPSDSIKVKSLGQKTDFDSKMKSLVMGFNYDYKTSDDKFLNSLTIRHYWYSMNTLYQDLYSNVKPRIIALNKTDLGFSEAMRYRFTSVFMGKLSGGYDVRLPAENELLGDGYSVSPSERLMPEKNLSFNTGLFYDLTGVNRSNLQVELNCYYMYLRNMIRYVKGVLGAEYQNFGEMRTVGVEFEAKADILPNLYGYGNITYQDLRDVRKYEADSKILNPTMGKRMPNIPYFMANSGLEFHKENLFGGREQNTRIFLDLSYVGEYYYDFEMTENEKRSIPASMTLDVGFEHSFFNQKFFISGKIKNLTNAKILSEFNLPLPGRSFGIKLRYIFK